MEKNTVEELNFTNLFHSTFSARHCLLNNVGLALQIAFGVLQGET